MYSWCSELLDEAHDDAHLAGCAAEFEQPVVVAAHRDLGVEVLEEVARQPELREHEQVDALARVPPRSCRRCVARFVVEPAEARRDLAKPHAHDAHRHRC